VFTNARICGWFILDAWRTRASKLTLTRGTMTRLTNKQAARFEAKLHTIAAQSVKVNNTLLRELAAKRDAHLANLCK